MMENKITERYLKKLIEERFYFRALLADFLLVIKAALIFVLPVTSILLSSVWLSQQPDIHRYAYCTFVFIGMWAITSTVVQLIGYNHIKKWTDRYYQNPDFYFVMVNDEPASLIPIDGYKRPKIKKNRRGDTVYLFRYPRTICYGHFRVRSPSAEIKQKQQITSWAWTDGTRRYLVQTDALPITKLVPDIRIWDQIDRFD